MERYLVVVCPGLRRDGALGREGRRFTAVMDAVGEFCPAVDHVAPGICALVTRGPARYFGGEVALAGRIRDAVQQVIETVQVGVADGLFAATLAATIPAGESTTLAATIPAGESTTLAATIPAGESASFLAPLPIAVLGREDLRDLLGRLGLKTLGDFARLPADTVSARFGAEIAACHRVVCGLESELPGMRVPPCRELPRRDARYQQFDFWGGASAADNRAARAVDAVRAIAGPESVFVARLTEGRAPAEQFSFVLWDKRPSRTPAPSKGKTPPWPGRIPPPPPALVHTPPLSAELTGTRGTAVSVGSRLDLAEAPARLSVDGGSWQRITLWAGPWVEDTAWWTGRRQRHARLQVVVAEGIAHLLATRAGGWVVEATYD